MTDDKRGALATETYVFECDEAIGEIEVVEIGCAPAGSRVARNASMPAGRQLSFVSTDGELRA